MQLYRRAFQRTQLLEAGRKAQAAINAGAKATDLLLTFPHSRATFYRALNLAAKFDTPEMRWKEAQFYATQKEFDTPEIDPLLL